MTQVTGVARRPDGTAYANAVFTFVRSPAIVVSQDGSVVTPLVTTVTANGAGAVDFEILPGNYEGQETATGRRFAFTVPDEVLVDFADCVDAAAIVNWPGAVETVLTARDEVLAALGADGVTTFNQADYMHADDLALIRAGVTAGQDASRVTAGIRLMHEEALAAMLAANGVAVKVVYEGGQSAINDSLMSPAFNQMLWDDGTARNSRIEFGANGPVIWQIVAWQGGQSAIRTDGIYSELLPAFKVPTAVWEWRQGPGYARLYDFSANVTIFGEGNHVTDPIGFRTYRINAARFSGQMNVMNLRNIAHFHEAMYNSTFDYMTSRQGCGWQPMEHGLPGMIDRTLRYTVSGSTVTIVNPDTGVSVPLFTADHVGRKFAMARQGIAQRSPDPEEESDIRGPKWFTITSVSGNTAQVTPTPDYPTGIDGQAVVGTSTFSFAAVRASTTAGSAVVTLSAPVADSLVGKVVSIVGAGYHLPGAPLYQVNALGENLTAIVVAHSGASVTLSVPAARTRSGAPFICSPQVYFGPEGAGVDSLLHSSWHPTDDVHLRRVWCEGSAHGVVQAHFQSMTGSSLTDDSKLHGASPNTHNSWGGNFATAIFSRVSMRVDALWSHGMYSPWFGKFIASGKKVELDLSGELVAWTTPTDSARYYLDPETAERVAFFVQENLFDNTLYFPQVSAGQVMVRGGGDYDATKLYVRSIGSARTPMGDEHPAWPPSEMGPTVATAFGSTRAGAVDAIARGLFTPLDGYVYDIGGVGFVGDTGATDIPDLPGLMPATPHYGAAFTTSAPSSATLIAAATLAGVKHVTLRQVLGSGYTEAQDASAILNAVTPALAAAGLTILNDEALSLSLKTRLQMCDDFRVDWGPAILWLDASSHHMITHDTTYDAGQAINRVWWHGGRVISRSTAIRGHVFQFDAADSVFENFSVEGYSGGMAFVFAGTDLVMRNIRTQSALVDTGGDDAFHLESGSRILCIGLQAECNDDCFIAVPPAHFTVGHPRYALPTTDVQYVGCVGWSHLARICVVALDAASDATLLPTEIKRVSFSDIKGSSSEGISIIGKATMNPGQIDEISFNNCNFTCIDGDGTTAGAWGGRIFQTYARPGCVGRVTFNQCTFDARAQLIGLNYDAPGATVTLRDTTIIGKNKAISLNYDNEMHIHGGHYGAVSGTDFPLYVTGNAHLTIDGYALIDGIGTGKSGVWANNGKIVVKSAVMNKLSGATGTYAVIQASGSTFELDEGQILGTVDAIRYTPGTGTLMVAPRSAPVRTGSKITTIASDLAALEFADLVVLDTEGSASTDNLAGLSAPAWLEPGDIITLAINNAWRTVTVKHSQTVTTGYFPIMTNSGGDLTISSTATRLKLQWTGAQFIDATWAAAGGGGSAYNAAFGGTAWEIIDPTVSSTITVTSTMVRLSGATTATVTQIDGLTSNVPLLFIRNTGPAVTLVHDINKLRLTGGVDRVLAQYEGMILARVNSTIWGEFGDGGGSVTAFTVATLPTASSSTRKRLFVTDATATTFYSVVSGGGANQVPVWSDGTNWRIG